MEHEEGTAGEFQRSTRMPLDAVVRLHFEGTVAYQNGFAANVSATGMFVKHPSPPPVGTPLVFEFNVGPQRKPVQGSGEVVWVRERYLGPGQPAGIGIRFSQLDSQSRDHIAEALFEFLERSLAEDSYLDPQQLAGQIGAEPSSIEDLATPIEPPPRIDLASVPRLPNPEGERADVEPFRLAPSAPVAPPPPAEKQPFAVFSSLDDADAKTAAIVREALREEPTAVFRAASAAEPERSGAPAAIWAVAAVALLAAGAWFGWQRFGPGASAAAAPAEAPAEESVAPEPEPPKPEPLSAEPGPGTLAEAVGVDPHVRSPAADPPAAGIGAPPGEPSDVEAAAETAAAIDSGSDPDVATPPPAAPGSSADTPPDAPPAEAITPPPGASAAKSIARFELAESATGAELVIAGDGAFTPGSFTYSEIGGENPRVLIKLRGMESPYRGQSPAANPLVRGVRTGFHLTGRGNEIHVVVDLTRPPAKVAALESGDSGLVLRLIAP